MNQAVLDEKEEDDGQRRSRASGIKESDNNGEGLKMGLFRLCPYLAAFNQRIRLRRSGSG